MNEISQVLKSATSIFCGTCSDLAQACSGSTLVPGAWPSANVNKTRIKQRSL